MAGCLSDVAGCGRHEHEDDELLLVWRGSDDDGSDVWSLWSAFGDLGVSRLFLHDLSGCPFLSIVREPSGAMDGGGVDAALPGLWGNDVAWAAEPDPIA
jgi:hypothetical protein